jgi:hypothetical protein
VKPVSDPFYVYALDPRKPGLYRYGHWVFHFEPFYVGKGKGKRFTKHERFALSGSTRNIHKVNKIRKIAALGYTLPVRLLRRNLDEQSAFDLEIRLISTIGRGRTGPLVNKTSGGEGISGYKHTAETKKKISDAISNISEEEREIRSQYRRELALSNPQWTTKLGSSNGKSKFSDKQVVDLRKSFRAGDITIEDIVSDLDVTSKTVKDMLKGVTYPHLKMYKYPEAKSVGRPSSLSPKLYPKIDKLLKVNTPIRTIASTLGVTRRSVKQYSISM